MNAHQHNQIVNFIWNIADDCLRDIYTRGKYRDVILPRKIPQTRKGMPIGEGMPFVLAL